MHVKFNLQPFIYRLIQYNISFLVVPFAQDLQLFLCWDEESEEHLDSTMLSNTMTTRDDGRAKKKRNATTSESDDDSSDVARLKLLSRYIWDAFVFSRLELKI